MMISRTVAVACLAALALCLCACVTAPIGRASEPTCAAAEHRQFDFWQGAWNVEQQIRQANGTWLALPARTDVRVSSDGCVVTEHWRGEVQLFWEGMSAPEAMWGFSVRRFDPTNETWAIYWMDQRRPAFDAPYVGVFDGARGVFYRTLATDNGEQRGRIVFEQASDGLVTWELSVATDAVSWLPLWRMHMRRM